MDCPHFLPFVHGIQGMDCSGRLTQVQSDLSPLSLQNSLLTPGYYTDGQPNTMGPAAVLSSAVTQILCRKDEIMSVRPV